jgi:2-keto-4-pentenoate hydratase/2-oxohepta-3-ene-1,7-dioic acid hydratase in catechol pathway
MLWARGRVEGRVVFGAVDGETLRVHAGDLFADPAPTGESLALSDITWMTPCDPGKFLGLWKNFHAAATKNGWSIPLEPLYFAKTPTTHLAHLATIEPPATYDGRVCYEGELGIVIGRRAKAVSVEAAAAAIFGYTCVNDVTAADLFSRDASFAQWTRAKSFDTFGVFGPVIATGLDPMTLTVRTILDGRERQNYPASDMIMDPATLVSLISRDTTLMPGDLIACGTSLGIGPMKPGSTVEIAIDGIGVLRNPYG